MINNVVLVGRITKDPELRTIASGSTTVSFTLAIDRPYSSNQQNGGNNQQNTDFINCVCWNQSANFLAQYVKKGYIVGVEGRITTRNYQDQSGQTRYVTEVLANRVQNLTPRSNGSNSNSNSYNQAPVNNNSNSNPVFEENMTDDDLPF
jgi:single-strand DNA-binding protein